MSKFIRNRSLLREVREGLSNCMEESLLQILPNPLFVKQFFLLFSSTGIWFLWLYIFTIRTRLPSSQTLPNSLITGTYSQIQSYFNLWDAWFHKIPVSALEIASARPYLNPMLTIRSSRQVKLCHVFEINSSVARLCRGESMFENQKINQAVFILSLKNPILWTNVGTKIFRAFFVIL